LNDFDEGAIEFFRAMHHQFETTLSTHRGNESMLAGLLSQAFTSYEGSAALQSEGMPEPDCEKGCATCCTVRVVATAPEILLVARYIRAMDEKLKGLGIDINQRLLEADNVTRGQSEEARVDQRQRCPYIHKGTCIIYSVRPLACRSHISYDKQSCIDAAAGRLQEIPYSIPHMQVRGLVQNALQSALRDAEYPWATYEVNHALSIALADNDVERNWLKGHDVFEAAMVNEISVQEMGMTFDRLHGRLQ
jgi:Fe-S-cluster containining protein